MMDSFRGNEEMIKICEMPSALVFMFKEQYDHFHFVVRFCKYHAEDLFDLTKNELYTFSEAVARVARAIKISTGAAGVGYHIYETDKQLQVHLTAKQGTSETGQKTTPSEEEWNDLYTKMLTNL